MIIFLSIARGILYDHIGHSATMNDMTHNAQALIMETKT